MAKKTNTPDPLRIVLGKHRVSYVHVKEPKAFDDGDPKYSVTFLIPYNHPDVERINAVIKAAYDANSQSLFKGMPMTSPKFWNPLRDGAEYLEDHPEQTEYEGHYYLKASSKSQPVVFDQYGLDVIDLDELAYSGAFMRGVLKASAYNNKSKGVSFYLNSLKFMEHGERLSGVTASADDYEDDFNDAPVKAPAKAAPKAAAKPARMFDEDADGNEIYSDDNGVSWFYVN